jgi:phage terminase small subunit
VVEAVGVSPPSPNRLAGRAGYKSGMNRKSTQSKWLGVFLFLYAYKKGKDKNNVKRTRHKPKRNCECRSIGSVAGAICKERVRRMLTAKQEKFVQKIIEGNSQADAYRAAYNTSKMTDKTIWEAASKLMADSKVSARLSELREQITSEKIMSAQKRMEWLTQLVMGEDASYSDRLKAIDIMNKMQGEYVQKVEADVKSEMNITVELVDE